MSPPAHSHSPVAVIGGGPVGLAAAHLAGDGAAANGVRLVLPETGACSTDLAPSIAAGAGCCGGPAPANIAACCADDAKAKASGDADCGCAESQKVPERVTASACCGTAER